MKTLSTNLVKPLEPGLSNETGLARFHHYARGLKQVQMRSAAAAVDHNSKKAPPLPQPTFSTTVTPTRREIFPPRLQWDIITEIETKLKKFTKTLEKCRLATSPT